MTLILAVLSTTSPASAGDVYLAQAARDLMSTLSEAEPPIPVYLTDDDAASAIRKASRKLDHAARIIDSTDAVEDFSKSGAPCGVRAAEVAGALFVATLGDCPASLGLPVVPRIPADAVVVDPAAAPLDSYRARRLYLGTATRRFQEIDDPHELPNEPIDRKYIQVQEVDYTVVCRGDDVPLKLEELGALSGDPDAPGNTFMGGLSRGWASVPAIFTPKPKNPLRATGPVAVLDRIEVEALIDQHNQLLRETLGLGTQETSTIDGHPGDPDAAPGPQSLMTRCRELAE